MEITKELNVGGKKLKISFGKLAKQANSSVLMQIGDTVVLVAVTMSDQPRKNLDFTPLTVEYREKTYAFGKIPGGFFKREGRPTETEILSARMIDRPIRTLFSDDLRNEIQIAVTTLSYDHANLPEIIALFGASIALNISDIPFSAPIGAVRVGKVSGELVINPTVTELENSTMNYVIVGTKDEIVMIDGLSDQISEDEFIKAIEFSRKYIYGMVEFQENLLSELNVVKKEIDRTELPEEVKSFITEFSRDLIPQIFEKGSKKEQTEIVRKLKSDLMESYTQKFPENDEELIPAIKKELEMLMRNCMRKLIISKGIRSDKRTPDEIRNIECEAGILPRTHGSALFSRGETQALVTITLGSSYDEQREEGLQGERRKNFMLHYNFPPYSVGEIRPFRGPGRREIGHGALAEKALLPVMPKDENFPYTVRVVSEILESNASSSMATVCGATLALMDAGVPIKDIVAGVSYGLIKDNDQTIILADINGIEDHYGDMDLKIAGTEKGITAVQMDLKISGISVGVLGKAITKSAETRKKIISMMRETISGPRSSLSQYAPLMEVFYVAQNKIGEIIGTSGKVIKKIQEKYSVEITIESDGKIEIFGNDGELAKKAIALIKEINEGVQLNRVYSGKIVRLEQYGAFVNLIPNTDGLLHISEISNERVNNINDVFKLGDIVNVKVINIDHMGKIRLSMKRI